METLSLTDLKVAYIEKYGDAYNYDWFPDFDTAFEAAWELFEYEFEPEPEIIHGLSCLWTMRPGAEHSQNELFYSDPDPDSDFDLDPDLLQRASLQAIAGRGALLDIIEKTQSTLPPLPKKNHKP